MITVPAGVACSLTTLNCGSILIFLEGVDATLRLKGAVLDRVFQEGTNPIRAALGCTVFIAANAVIEVTNNCNEGKLLLFRAHVNLSP